MPPNVMKESDLVAAEYRLGIPENFNSREVLKALLEAGFSEPKRVPQLGVIKYGMLLFRSDVSIVLAEFRLAIISSRKRLEAVMGRNFDEEDPFAYQTIALFGEERLLGRIGTGIPDQVDSLNSDEADYSTAQIIPAVTSTELIGVYHRIRAASVAGTYERLSERMNQLESAQMNTPISSGSEQIM